jgi:type I restriction enzyme M protein
LNKKNLSESDISDKFIRPAIVRAGWHSIEQIKAANYNLDQKNPHAVDAVSHDPEQLLADYARLQGEAQGLRDALREILAKSLNGQSLPTS